MKQTSTKSKSEFLIKKVFFLKKLHTLYTLTCGFFRANTLNTAFFYFAILFFIIGFGFRDVPTPYGWYQQFMPNLNGQYLSDIFFIDTLNGWAVTGTNSSSDSGYILKTTNRGDFWTIKFKNRNNFQRIFFINQNTGFTCGNDFSISNGFLYKSTNAGENWFSINVPDFPIVTDMAILNQDTIWIIQNEINGNIFRTTNGGLNWTTQFSIFGSSINKIYMYNRNIGFACTSGLLLKTTNSGLNWNQIGGQSVENPFYDMYFVDSLTGWKSNNYTNSQNHDTNIVKTTNGGLNWIAQRLPTGGWGSLNIDNLMYKFSKISGDTIRGSGGYLSNNLNYWRGIIYTTTNGGTNWLFQVPDTSFGITGYSSCIFVNNKVGWAYGYNNTGIHTTVGGDTVFYIGIVEKSKNIPNDFILKQNYPNPFNPRTVIPYSLKSAAYVKLVAYDILGKEVQRLVDQKQNAGEYEVDFMGKFSASGVYFYRMEVTDDKSKQLFSETRTMILLK